MTDLAGRIARLSPAAREQLIEQLRDKGVQPPLVAYAYPSRKQAPTSPAQRRILFLQRLDPHGSHYHTPLACRLSGGLDRRALVGALETIVERHAVLRTVFPMVDGVAVQRIDPPGPIDLRVLDLGRLEAAAQEAEWQALLRHEREAPFDLEHHPPVRFRLLILSAEQALLLITFHHVAVDGWSLSVFSRELCSAYDGLCGGTALALPPLPVQFADYSSWQSDWSSGPVAQRQLRYWQDELTGAPQRLTLATDRPRPLVQSHRGATVRLAFPAELTTALRGMSERAGVTLYMTLLAGFALLLGRHSGQDEVVIGAPIANRRDEATHGLIGFFANTILFRIRLSPDQSFGQLLTAVSETCARAYEHQDMPIDMIARRLFPGRDLAANPLYQVNFTLHNTPAMVQEVRGLTIAALDFDTGSARFDLDLNLWESPDGLRGYIEYPTDLFDRDTVTRLAESLETLLAAAAAHPARPAGELPIMSEARLRQVLVAENDTARPWSGPALIHRLIEEQVTRTPSAIAVSSARGRTTYAELDSRANQLANRLRAVGVRRGDLVGVLLARSPELIVALLAVMKSGAAYIPLDPRAPASRTDLILAGSGATVLVTGSVLPRSIVDGATPAGSVVPTIVDVDGSPDPAGWSDMAPDVASVADDALYVMYTSGSTGRPKGVMVSHRSVANYLSWFAATVDMTAGEGVAVHTSASFDLSVTSLLVPLLGGQRVELLEDTDVPGEALTRWVNGGGVTPFLKLTPSHLRLLTQAGVADQLGRRVGALVVGGEALGEDHLSVLRKATPPIRVINEYGPTETAVACTHHEVGTETAPTGRVPIGRPIANTQVYVLDSRLRPVAPGAAGELFVGGAGVAYGYWRQPALTADRFVPDPFGPCPGARLYRTGDLVRRLAGGELEFLGRLDGQVKIRGHRVEPDEIRSVLLANPAVGSAAVTVSTARSADPELVAYVHVAEGGGHADDDGSTRRLDEWEGLYREVYQTLTTAAPDLAELVGWTDSYTAAPIPREQMMAWRARTVDRVLRSAPRHVLEIGCGTGMILRGVAPRCESYIGTDISPQALDFVRQRLAEEPVAAHVELRQAAAHQAIRAADEVDMVVLNSVAQYFPSHHYLADVIRGAVHAMPGGGHIFVGDVRHLGLLELLHGSIQLTRAAPGERVADVAAAIRRGVLLEEELCLAPSYFHHLVGTVDRLVEVSVQPRGGPEANELTRFRYDVTLTVAPITADPSRHDTQPDLGPQRRNWADGAGSLPALRAVLTDERPDVLVLTDVPHPQLASIAASLQSLRRLPPQSPVSEVLTAAAATTVAGCDPEELFRLGDELGYHIAIGGWGDRADGAFDVVLSSTKANLPRATTTGTRHANNPLWRRSAADRMPGIRAHLVENLPAAMVPGVLVAVPEIPLTANGKVDHQALSHYAELLAGDQAGARFEDHGSGSLTGTEAAISEIWRELLGPRDIRPQDDFFALGGHSLLTFQLAFRMRKRFDIDLPVRIPFEKRRLSELAAHVDQLRSASQPADTERAGLARTEQSGPPAISSAQERLWFVHQLDPAGHQYNVPAYMRVDGDLDFDLLRRCLDAVVDRHEVLRTVFSAVDGQPRARVLAAGPLPWAVVDLRALAADDGPAADDEVQRLARADYERAFDLSRDIPIRVAVVRMSEHRHVLLLTMHHIVFDAWSLGVLLDELTTMYQAGRHGQAIALPGLERQYADYARWQERQLAEGRLDASVDYWRRQLGGILTRRGLPPDRPRPVRPSFAGDRLTFDVPADTVAALTRLATQQGATLFMVLLAPLFVVLGRRAGERDVVVGTDVANRQDIATERMIGFFVNQLVLRGDLSGGPTWRELLARTRTMTLDAFVHQDVPFDHVVRALNPPRSRRQSPLFDAKIVLNNTDRRSYSLPDLRVTPFPFELKTARFDLTVLLEEDGPVVRGIWEYDTDLFDRPTMAAMCHQYTGLLAAMAAGPDEPVDATPVTAKSEPAMSHRAGLRQAPAKVTIRSTETVHRGLLRPEQDGPLVFTPIYADVDLVGWATANRELVEADLARHGALMFRGFGIRTPEALERFAGVFTGDLMADNGEHNKVQTTNSVFTPVFFAPKEKLLWHNENSFNARGPGKIWFCCARPADSGGETPVADSRQVFRRLPDHIRQPFLSLGVRYVRTYLPGLGVAWSDVFGTNDRTEVDRRCHDEGIQPLWRGDVLTTSCVRPAAVRHPRTGEWSWISQAQHWHPSCLNQATRDSLRAVVAADQMPRDCTYGDGSPIDDGTMAEILRVYQDCEVSFPWQSGDVMMLDNILAAHARNPYRGERSLLVAMGDLVEFR